MQGLDHAVLIIDDSKQVLAAIARSLRRKGFDPVTFSRANDAQRAIVSAERPPEAAIIDIVLDGGCSGLHLAALFRQQFPQTIPLLLITAYDANSSELLREAEVLRANVLSKPWNSSQFDRFLANVAAVSPITAVTSFRDHILWISDTASLTPQEARIVGQLAAGSTRANLARHLGISENTLKSQLRRLLSKTGVLCCDELIGLLLQVLAGKRPEQLRVRA